MTLAKWFLLFNFVIWLPYGIACLINPEMLSGLAGVNMTSPTAITEIRAMYGGVQSAVGVICLFGLLKESMMRPALAMLSFVFAGVAAARVFGLVIDSSGSAYTYGAICFEIFGTVASVFLLLKQPIESP